MQADRQTDRQTNKQTDILITILRTLPGVKVKMNSLHACNFTVMPSEAGVTKAVAFVRICPWFGTLSYFGHASFSDHLCLPALPGHYV